MSNQIWSNETAPYFTPPTRPNKFLARKSSNQTITSSLTTIVTFPTVVINDPNLLIESTDFVKTVPPGLYLFKIDLRWAPKPAAVARFVFNLFNRTTGVEEVCELKTINGALSNCESYTVVISVSQTTEFDVRVNQNTGSPLDILSNVGPTFTRWEIIKL